MIAVPEIRPPLPGWHWFVCAIAREHGDLSGRLVATHVYGLFVPAPDWAAAEAALAEWNGFGIVEGQLEARA